MYQPHLLAALRLGWGRGHYALVSRTLWLRKGGKERVHEKKIPPRGPSLHPSGGLACPL